MRGETLFRFLHAGVKRSRRLSKLATANETASTRIVEIFDRDLLPRLCVKYIAGSQSGGARMKRAAAAAAAL